MESHPLVPASSISHWQAESSKVLTSTKESFISYVLFLLKFAGNISILWIPYEGRGPWGFQLSTPVRKCVRDKQKKKEWLQDIFGYMKLLLLLLDTHLWFGCQWLIGEMAAGRKAGKMTCFSLFPALKMILLSVSGWKETECPQLNFVSVTVRTLSLVYN